jgi:hypothetical protein
MGDSVKPPGDPVEVGQRYRQPITYRPPSSSHCGPFHLYGSGHGVNTAAYKDLAR